MQYVVFDNTSIKWNLIIFGLLLNDQTGAKGMAKSLEYWLFQLNSSLWWSNRISCLPQTPGMHVVHKHMCRQNTLTFKIFLKWTINKWVWKIHFGSSYFGIYRISFLICVAHRAKGTTKYRNVSGAPSKALGYRIVYTWLLINLMIEYP